MPRCPECGRWIWHTPGYLDNNIVCSGCGAILRRKGSVGGFFLGSLEVVGHAWGESPSDEELQETDEDSHNTGLQETDGYGHGSGWSYAREEARLIRNPHYRGQGSSQGLSAAPKEPTLRGEGVKWDRCNHCHAVIMISNAKFCSNCGSSLSSRQKYATPPRIEEPAKPVDQTREATEHGEECMVCNLELHEGDDVVWCPHCGSPAHRNHLLKWIHVKNACPICGRHLSEDVFQ